MCHYYLWMYPKFCWIYLMSLLYRKIDSFFGRHFCTLKSLESPIELKFGMVVHFSLLLLLNNHEINSGIIKWWKLPKTVVTLVHDMVLLMLWNFWCHYSEVTFLKRGLKVFEKNFVKLKVVSKQNEHEFLSSTFLALFYDYSCLD